MPISFTELGTPMYLEGSGNEPFVSVIIPHFNDLANLQQCLLLLSEQTFPRDRFEVIVADNNSEVGLANVEKICGIGVRVVSARTQGAAAARNAGVAAAHGQILAFTDSDCRPALSWLSRGVSALMHSEIVGGQVETTVEDERNPTPVEAFEKVFSFDFKRYIQREGFSGTGNMFVPRSVFDQVGGFRLGVSEDKDWGQRAVASGFQWTYAADVQVSHPARRNWQELKRKWERITRETYRIEREKRLGRLRWMILSCAILISPFVHFIRVLRSPKLRHLGDRRKAIGVLFRLRIWRFFESYRILASDLFPHD